MLIGKIKPLFRKYGTKKHLNFLTSILMFLNHYFQTNRNDDGQFCCFHLLANSFVINISKRILTLNLFSEKNIVQKELFLEHLQLRLNINYLVKNSFILLSVGACKMVYFCSLLE